MCYEGTQCHGTRVSGSDLPKMSRNRVKKCWTGFPKRERANDYYEGIEVGTRRADFVVEDKVVVELKAQVSLEDVHLAQAKNYVVAYDFSLGLLINFGGQSLQYKLLFNPKYHPKSNSENSKIL